MLAIMAAKEVEAGSSPEEGLFVDIFFKEEHVVEPERVKDQFDFIKLVYDLDGTVEVLIELGIGVGECGWRYNATSLDDQAKAERALRAEFI